MRRAVRVLTHQLALRHRADRFVALPVASWFFADCLALRFRCLAVGHAVGLRADGDALRAVEGGAALIWALDGAFWLFALDVADSVARFSA